MVTIEEKTKALDAISAVASIIALFVFVLFTRNSLNRQTINLELKTAIDRRIRDVEATQQEDREVSDHA